MSPGYEKDYIPHFSLQPAGLRGYLLRTCADGFLPAERRAGHGNTLCRRRQQKPDSALSYLERAYSLASFDLKTIIDLGGVLLDGKAYDKADSLIDTGLELDSMNG